MVTNGFVVPDALEYLGLEVDEQTERIIGILEKKGSVSENDLAETLGIKVNETRKLLYKLHEVGFVEYSKKKDEEKKWWYIYFWSLNKGKLHDIYIRRKKKELADKHDQLQAEQKYSFECSKCKRKYEYEHALSHGFSCHDCSASLSEVKNSKLMHQLEKDISRIRREIGDN